MGIVGPLLEVGGGVEWLVTENSGRNKLVSTLAVFTTDWSGSDLSNNLVSLESLTDSLELEVLAR